jgi:hypothetical protein
MSSGIMPEYWEAWRPSNLDADDRIAISVYDLDRLGRRHQPQITAFADHNATSERINAGEGYVKKSKDSCRRGRPDYMFQKTRIVAWPRAARIDHRRAPAASETKRIDSKRGAAPIDMSM